MTITHASADLRGFALICVETALNLSMAAPHLAD
jgi:hypothetical protein